MIRRDSKLSDGRRGWALVSQIEHARVAGLLAESWGGADFAPLWPRAEVLATLYRHDDGWGRWEQHPDVLPAKGWPRDFTEMPTKVSLDIWRASILEVSRFGFLQPWLVAGHFSALLRRFDGWRYDPRSSEAARRFLAEQDAARCRWLAQWQQQNVRRNTIEAAELALAQLQFFDFFSLWICYSKAKSAWMSDTPGGKRLTLDPLPGSDPSSATMRIAAFPWPFTINRVAVDAMARVVPQEHYADATALEATLSEERRLSWELVPGEAEAA